MTPEELARLIDQTVLRPEATPQEIDELCERAAQSGFANVCVNPWHVPRCAALLKGCRVGVCTVVGFPLGANTTEVKRREAEKACDDGASELDMVMNIGQFLAGHQAGVAADIEAVVQAASGQALVKVILETGLLTDDQKVAACELVMSSGAAFVKTSTGFGPGGATVHDVALMRSTVGSSMGVKASGGIRTAAQALGLVGAGASRLGTSAGEKLLDELRRSAP